MMSSEGCKRLRQLSQACLNYGQHVQFSVFECRVTGAEGVGFRDVLVRLENVQGRLGGNSQPWIGTIEIQRVLRNTP